MADTPHSGPGPTQPQGFFRRAADLYIGGFREMTVGRRLWAIILVKLAIMFLVFKLFFFPDKLAEEYDNDADRARAVRSSLVGDPHPSPSPLSTDDSNNNKSINLLPNE